MKIFDELVDKIGTLKNDLETILFTILTEIKRRIHFWHLYDHRLTGSTRSSNVPIGPGIYGMNHNYH